MRPIRSRPGVPRGLAAAIKPGAVLGWLAFLAETGRYIAISALDQAEQPYFIHYDFRVYWAGAQQLVERTLYEAPLDLAASPLPIEAFNLPPLAALLVVPLLPLGATLAGAVWQVASAVALALAAVVMGRLWDLSWELAATWAGVVLGLFMVLGHIPFPDDLTYWWGLVLGNNSYLMLGLTACVALCVRHRRDRVGGLLWGLGVAIKIWPIALLPFLLRERRWTTITWAVGGLAVQAAAFLIVLGPATLVSAIEALGTTADPRTIVIGVAAPARFIDWWPAWVPALSAGLLMAIPARGRLGFGLGILAGLAAITNLWGHYLPTVLFGLGVAASGVWTREIRDPSGRPAPLPAAS